MVRKKKNRIERLKGDDGVWVDDKEALKSLAVKLYSNLFRADESAGGDFITGPFPTVDPSTLEEIEREVNEKETVRALRGMGLYKALGLDGFQAIFYRRTWHLTRKIVHEFVREVMA